MFLTKNSQIEKKKTHLQQLPQKKQAPKPYRSDSLQNFNNCLTPTY